MTISTKLISGNRARITLSDTGCGMSADKVVQIFQPFYTDKNKGTGLGLAIVRNSIESHQGEILVESRIDEGTTFNIILP